MNCNRVWAAVNLAIFRWIPVTNVTSTSLSRADPYNLPAIVALRLLSNIAQQIVAIQYCIRTRPPSLANNLPFDHLLCSILSTAFVTDSFLLPDPAHYPYSLSTATLPASSGQQYTTFVFFSSLPPIRFRVKPLSEGGVMSRSSLEPPSRTHVIRLPKHPSAI